MKSIITMTVVAILLAMAGTYHFNLLPKTASSINDYDESRITRIEIQEVQGDITYKIDDPDSISDVMAVIGGDYKVNKMSEKQEVEYLIKTPPKLIITVFVGESEITESFIITNDNSIVVANTASMQSDKRTVLFKSLEEQTKIIDRLINIIGE